MVLIINEGTCVVIRCNNEESCEKTVNINRNTVTQDTSVPVVF